MNDGTSLYIGFGSYIKELNIPKLTYLNGVIVKNIIILGHNLLVLIPVSLICWMPVSASGIIWSLFGFLLTSLFLFPVIIILALVGLRFRDVPNIINSLMQIVFYITPIMWKVRLIPEQYHYLLIFNPFAVFISICRDPLLMTDIPDYYLFAAIIYTLFAWIIGFLLFGRFRTRIVYWL